MSDCGRYTVSAAFSIQLKCIFPYQDPNAAGVPSGPVVFEGLPATGPTLGTFHHASVIAPQKAGKLRGCGFLFFVLL